MTTLLAEHRRKARKRHLCMLCWCTIEPGSNYLEQRLADGGQAYTHRAHHACHSAFWSWFDWRDDPDGVGMLQDLSEGHLPPCDLAWNQENNPDAVPPPCRCVLPGQADIFGGAA